MSDLEIRQFGFRAAVPSLNGDNKLSGRAAPFDSQTLIGTTAQGFREKIHPKAFNKTLIDGDQVLLDNHDPHRPLARRSAGSLELHAGPVGLDWRATAADSSYARDVVANVKAGLYGGCSFSFECVRDKWSEGQDGVPERELLEVNCREISVVTFPAYSDTTVSARSLVDAAMEYRYAFWAGVMEPEISVEELRAGNPKPYGDVKYADPKNGKYPIDTEEHARAAWAYINKASNAAKYPLNGVTLAEVKGRIKAACKKFGIQISGDADEQNAEPPQFTYETDDFEIVTRGEWSPAQWDAFQKELQWVNKISGFGPDGEPVESTRNLTKEESALLESRMAKKALEQRRAIFESRKANFQK